MKCVYVCVSVCLFRYVGIVSCRYIKETHGMKDDDNDNDREKNGNFGNSFHFRQIHTHTDGRIRFQATKYFNAQWSRVQLMMELINDDAPPKSVQNKIE